MVSALKITGIEIQFLERILVLTDCKTGFAETLLLRSKWIPILVIIKFVMDNGSLWARKRVILER